VPLREPVGELIGRTGETHRPRPASTGQAVEFRRARPRRLLGAGEDRHHANDEAQPVGIAAVTLGQCAPVLAACRRFGSRRAFRQNDFRAGGGAGPLRASRYVAMQEHRLSLHRTRHVERPAHGEELPGMLDRMDVHGVGECAGRLVNDEAAIFPAVPKLPRNVDQLDQARLGVFDRRWHVGGMKPVAQFRPALEPGDPAGASKGEMVERREDPRDVERLGDVTRPPGAETDLLGGADHRSEERQRIQPDAVDPAACARRHRRGRQAEQHRIEPAAFGRSCHRPKGRGGREACFILHAPCSGMPAMGGERGQEMHRCRQRSRSNGYATPAQKLQANWRGVLCEHGAYRDGVER